MSVNTGTSGARQQRLATYLGSLAEAAGHADRVDPLKFYCTGLLLPGERKSIEPMAARLAPENVRRMHQSLHHVVADAPWSDEALLGRMRDYVLPAIEQGGSIVAWILDDTGLPKEGIHSVGVERQYCGQTGKQDNCQVAVSLSVATWKASLPIAYRLYLPEAWAKDSQRREKAGIRKEILFQTKVEIALGQIRKAIADGTVLADPVTVMIRAFASLWRSRGSSMCWVSTAPPPSGRRGHSRYHLCRGKAVAGGPPAACAAIQSMCRYRLNNWLGTLRRPRLARLPPSRHTLHCRLWIPGGGEESFFSLSPCKASWIINSRTPEGVPAPRCASVRNGITRIP